MRGALTIGGSLLATILAASLAGSQAQASAAAPITLKPLRVLTSNPRYFTDGSGRAVYLTGAHTWTNLVDRGLTNPPERFDYDAYLDFLTAHHHNLIRLWTWELPRYRIEGATWYTWPQPWSRTGPGLADDGLPKFDLTRPSPDYFWRLRDRVVRAGQRGIYVSVMLFEGYGTQFAEPPSNWDSHPFNPANNVQGIDGRGIDMYTLRDPAVLRAQDRYVDRVLGAVADLPNVLFEVSNETHGGSTDWQYRMIRYVRQRLAARHLPRPIGMTYQYQGGDNRTLLRSGADWISPGGQIYLHDPPAAPRGKVSFSDTDHQCGICGGAALVWKSFLRGHNVLLMDDLRADPAREAARVAMGDARRLAERIDLARDKPQPSWASTRYCLASRGREYLVYQPAGGSFSVDLRGTNARFRVEWLDPAHATSTAGADVTGGHRRWFSAPFAGPAVLLLRKR